MRKVPRSHLIAGFAAAILIAGLIVTIALPGLKLAYLACFRKAIIAVVNAGQEPLRDVRLLVVDAEGRRIAREFSQVMPLETARVRVKTSDLYLGGLEFGIGDKRFEHDRGGMAVWGETFVLEIQSDGSVRTKSVTH